MDALSHRPKGQPRNRSLHRNIAWRGNRNPPQCQRTAGCGKAVALPARHMLLRRGQTNTQPLAGQGGHLRCPTPPAKTRPRGSKNSQRSGGRLRPRHTGRVGLPFSMLFVRRTRGGGERRCVAAVCAPGEGLVGIQYVVAGDGDDLPPCRWSAPLPRPRRRGGSLCAYPHPCRRRRRRGSRWPARPCRRGCARPCCLSAASSLRYQPPMSTSVPERLASSM